MEFLLTLTSFSIWLYLLFFYANKKFSFQELFWTNKVVFENELIKKKTQVDNLCIIIPARNEEQYIPETLRSISNLTYSKISVLIIDDNSTDDTVKISKNILNKKKIQNFIVKGKKLPKGWSGKVWALKQGIDFLKKKKFSFYLFLDSDIKLEKNVVNEAVSYLRANNLVMVSMMAKLNCKNFWEKLLIPSFIYFFQKIYPFSRVNNPKDSLSAAAGGFILCRANLFKNENLYDFIKNKVIDDCNLAKIIKKKGNIWLGLTEKVYSQRNYNKISQIWLMVSRTAYEQLNFSLITLICSAFAMVLIYLYPIFSIIYFLKIDNNFLFFVSLFSTILMTISIIPTILFYKLNFLYFFSLPLSSIIYIMMTITSALNFYFKKGNVWKGRKY